MFSSLIALASSEGAGADSLLAYTNLDVYLASDLNLSHISLASILWDIGKTRRLTRIPTVCFQKFLLKFDNNEKCHPATLKLDGLVQLISMRIYIRHKWVKSQSTFFQSYRIDFLSLTYTKLRITCLVQGHNTVHQLSFEPANPRSQV